MSKVLASNIERVNEAFERTPRIGFLPPEVQACWSDDRALPIRFEQTNSQPSLVRDMLCWLAVEPGDKVLDVGSGSGWTTALLSRLTGPKGKVVAVERIPNLVAFGRDNCERLHIRNAEFHQSIKRIGWPEAAPYDRILVSATALKVSKKLLSQLAPGGRAVMPIRNHIEIWNKDSKGRMTLEDPKQVVKFVPLIKDPA